jgi:hypothetical protein
VGKQVFIPVVGVSELGHHGTDRLGFDRRQFFFVDGSGDGLVHLSFCPSRHRHAGPFSDV